MVTKITWFPASLTYRSFMLILRHDKVQQNVFSFNWLYLQFKLRQILTLNKNLDIDRLQTAYLDVDLALGARWRVEVRLRTMCTTYFLYTRLWWGFWGCRRHRGHSVPRTLNGGEYNRSGKLYVQKRPLVAREKTIYFYNFDDVHFCYSLGATKSALIDTICLGGSKRNGWQCCLMFANWLAICPSYVYALYSKVTTATRNCERQTISGLYSNELVVESTDPG